MDREFALLHNLISIARIRVPVLVKDYRVDEFIKGIRIKKKIAIKTNVRTIYRGAFAGALLKSMSRLRRGCIGTDRASF